MKIKEVDIHKLKKICYIYGVYIWASPFLASSAGMNPIFNLIISFISTCLIIYIMLRFKEALNKCLHSVKMDNPIKYLIYMYIWGYSLNILALGNPEGIMPYQAILGIGLVALYVVYGILLRNLDAPLEKLSKLKSLNIYSNCILVSLAMALSIVGVVFFIILMGASYFFLGNLFVELYNIEDEEALD